KMVKTNGEFVRATIWISSYSNVMRINYVEKNGLTWKCSNQHDEIVGYVPGVEINVDSVKVEQKFYIKRQLSSDITLEIRKLGVASHGRMGSVSVRSDLALMNYV
ncbi:41258_t:CDS:1, partial [Gigaspora margarita]